MKNVTTLTISFSIIVFALLSLTIDIAHSDSVSPLRPTDDILRSKAAFAVVDEAIVHGLNLHTLSESDYWKLQGPVLLEPQTDIHYQLRKQFGRIVNTVDFGASSDTGSSNQSPPINRGDKPILHKKAAEIIRDFIAQKHISIIIMSDAPIGMGEMAAIRGLQGEVRYTYAIINGACVFAPLKNFASLIKQPFIAEVWPDREGNLQLDRSVPQIGANNVHNAPTDVPPGLDITGAGVNVAVVDTGIDSSHPEFLNRITDTRGAYVYACEDHGTHVAGIIGAANNIGQITGVAPEVSFLDATVGINIVDTIVGVFLTRQGVAYSEAMDAIGWAVTAHRISTATQKADVINMSLGWDPWAYGREGTDSMSELIDEQVLKGVVFVTAAGNEVNRRASNQINFPPPNNPIPKLPHPFTTSTQPVNGFTIPAELNIEVTLIWDNGSNDLDLAILDSQNNEVCSSRNHEEGLTQFFPWNEPYGGTTNYEAFFEQVKCKVVAGNTYTVQVEGYKGQGNQKYEVWLNGTDRIGDPKCRITLKRIATFTNTNPTSAAQNAAQTVSVPGYSDKVITVGAIDRGKTIAKFSGHGPSDTSLIKPDVVAPGVDINSTIPIPKGRYGTKNGTSMAAPHVAGVAALILDAVGKNSNGKWNFSPAEVKSAIVRGAKRGRPTPIPNTPNNTYGAGLVKADNIIFGGTVDPGQKLLFRITPRLTGSSFPGGTLNAGDNLAVAISSEQNFPNPNDLKLLIFHRNGTPPPIIGGTALGANYKKIIISPSGSLGYPDKCFYLNIKYPFPTKTQSIVFTGASTYPIEEINPKLDVNDDGVVYVKDLAEVADVLVAAKKLTVSHTDSHYDVDKDVDGDNDVDLDDMEAIANEITDAAAAPSAHPAGIETIQQWLAEAKRMGNIDPDFLQSIEVLEQLLDLLTPIIPMETALLPNYPNPFNPETWIPYQLANPADVTLTIHAVDGKLVRALDLGHQRPGMYQSRARAAHWDGRNAQGEPVASGVYFYTLKAGDFSATRKMLIRK